MPDKVTLESLPWPATLAHKEEQVPQELALSARASQCARSMISVRSPEAPQRFSERLQQLNERMQAVFALAESALEANPAPSNGQRWLADNADLLRSELAAINELRHGFTRAEQVRRPDREVAPRVLAIADDLLAALNYRFDGAGFAAYLHAFQQAAVLRLEELSNLVPALKFVLLEKIAEATARSSQTERWAEGKAAIATSIQSIREIREAPHKELLEPFIVMDEVLRQDPAGAYARMDAETRNMYRRAVVKMAENSDHSEIEIAEMAISLARQSEGQGERDPRLALRRSHVGYYLMAEGRPLLDRRAGVRLPFRDRFREFVRRYPDELYLLGIEVLTVSMILPVVWWVNFSSLWGMYVTALALLLPCSQSAVEIVNYFMTSLFEPQPLPKLDFREGVPDDCTTMVVVPSLLLNEKQVRQLVEQLEVRYVGNTSPNLHFALLTDLPDATEESAEDGPLVELCGRLIEDLNQRYAGNGAGTFAMFHRHMVYNRHEGVWMGWERKRGKLLDFNKLILGEYDSFPYKVGDLSVLPRVRYVLTLDADTELPRGTARRLIGTIAHPLCQAIIDSERNIVTQGYGILQPRVGVSIRSATESRLAAIYSGKTGFDIYTRAISDVYQDLYGEGTFVGKGLYEVRTVHRVLDHRFPRNTILSHDLIEGAYTRAALVSDVEVIDQYPSRYGAFTRRRHRWVRGDWQILEWLLSRAPDESGRRVANPISVISRWKILDNLRRSLVEPATVALFLLAWTVLPGRPVYWTLVALAILAAPAAVQFAVSLVRALLVPSAGALEGAFVSLATGVVGVLLHLALLLHGALVCTDAIWRTLYRRFSREKLLEWETAAEAEMGAKKRTPVDQYLLSIPLIALSLGLVVYVLRRPALPVALPILISWGCGKLISLWLDRPPSVRPTAVVPEHEEFLRGACLRTWRYFAELSTEEHNWLIPDNVQEEPARIAAQVSPSNLGLLLNARQVACELGYLAAPEFVRQTRRTLETMKRLRTYRGHLFNWYNTRTLEPLEPLFVSSVDSGNLAAALIALSGGCQALLDKPLLTPALLDGYDDHLRALAELKATSSRAAARFIRAWKRLPFVRHVLAVVSEPPTFDVSFGSGAEADWFAAQLEMRRESLRTMLNEYLPWLLPEFEGLRRACGMASDDAGAQIPLAHLPEFIQDLESKLRSMAHKETGSEEERQRCDQLLALLPDAHTRNAHLVQDCGLIASEAERWFRGMEFGFLLDERRQLLSIGFNVEGRELHPSCYDLLASESRVATFVGIAKGDIPQDVWFKLGRQHVPTRGGPTLISWAGTMFEYLMPALWMRSYPGTLLRRSMEAAVDSQRVYAAGKHIPWGISESAHCERDSAGAYQYRAFGVPELALQSGEEESLVVAPYASVLALAVKPVAALGNLQRMARRGWIGRYGFYEAADFRQAAKSRRERWRLVKAFMAHHEGMSLLAMANFLCSDVVQQWFHRDVRIQATELLLQERIVVHNVRRTWRARAPQRPLRTPALPGEKLALSA